MKLTIFNLIAVLSHSCIYPVIAAGEEGEGGECYERYSNDRQGCTDSPDCHWDFSDGGYCSKWDDGRGFYDDDEDGSACTPPSGSSDPYMCNMMGPKCYFDEETDGEKCRPWEEGKPVTFVLLTPEEACAAEISPPNFNIIDRCGNDPAFDHAPGYYGMNVCTQKDGQCVLDNCKLISSSNPYDYTGCWEAGCYLNFNSDDWFSSCHSDSSCSYQENSEKCSSVGPRCFWDAASSTCKDWSAGDPITFKERTQEESCALYCNHYGMNVCQNNIEGQCYLDKCRLAQVEGGRIRCDDTMGCLWINSDGGYCSCTAETADASQWQACVEKSKCVEDGDCPEGKKCDKKSGGLRRKLFGQMATGVCV